ncbi:dynamin family protein [Aetokthonos hydrillicola Thurmond2011]|jgi:GTPase SAR1 family protein|uniref:Dynamin family protein n=1 Tax=Aetokthonos hydrillicola Thurmond2011 TaxID=2712845 RepID=A0AAP5ME02_9CYAN|nr:dynamin family protein [Aetokthonos hydrillicola]MBO3457260.1 dynamin family protein [Aetokthonos hydrillicola CCALA 1050]MBW4586602.1 dynamin family protein [Aetokthonos hydrillicola CCALA 1050]MDR9900124.1 dynamin family protein [Aetokthonos hydrillicola Thurmond2011]
MESAAKSFSYDFTYLRQEFLQIVADFREAFCLEKFQTDLGKQIIKQIQLQVEDIRKRLHADFVLVVIGDFKRGKSTLINALLGETIVTTDVLPETVTINHIQYGPELKINLYLTNGEKIELDKEELKAEKLEQILAELPQPVSHLKIETPNEWLKGLRLVDTPGTGDILKRFDRQVHTYLLQADAVIFVSSALAPFAESEQAFLQMSVIPQDFQKIFLVLNRMDDLRTEEDIHRIFNSNYRKISHLFPAPQLFAISALDEVFRIQSLPRPNPTCASSLERAFGEFRQSLDQAINLQRHLIQLNRASDRTEQMLQEVETNLLCLRDTLEVDQGYLSYVITQYTDPNSELFDRIAQHIQAMKDEINQLSEQTCRWMNEFLLRLDYEAIATISNFKIQDIKKHFQFFLHNSLRNAIDKCLAVHQPAISASYQKAQTAIFAEFKDLTNATSALNKQATETVTNQDYSGTDWNTFEILYECDTSTFITDLFIRQIQDLRISENNINYQRRLQAALPDFKVAIVKEIPTLYNNIATKIEQQVENTYRQTIETSLSAMQQAQEVSLHKAQTVRVTNETLQDALSIVYNARQQIKALKQKLCSEDMVESVSLS